MDVKINHDYLCKMTIDKTCPKRYNKDVPRGNRKNKKNNLKGIDIMFNAALLINNEWKVQFTTSHPMKAIRELISMAACVNEKTNGAVTLCGILNPANMELLTYVHP